MYFSNQLIQWYLKNQRDLPWRKTNNPYYIWLSEIIFQQTRIAQGTAYYLKFCEKFPTINDLANADEDTVLKYWQGLGYYTRARNLHHTAKFIVRHYNGEFPKSYKNIIKLRGIGEYTAAAITSICFDKPFAVVDGNVYRVLSRYFNINTPINSAKGVKQFKQLAQTLINVNKPGDHNQAVMELGALICTPKNAKCSICPLQKKCLALQNNNVTLLPVKYKKKKLKKRFFNFFVMDLPNDRTVVEKRENNDIWQNLYQFPMFESTSVIDQNQIIETNLFKKLTHKIPFSLQLFNKKPIVHKLTHQHIYTSFWIIKTKYTHKDSVEWKNISNLAVPILIHNFINNYKK